MMNTDLAGDNGTAPELGPMRYQATLGKKKSPHFDTLEEAREWIATQRSKRNLHDESSTLSEVPV